MNIIHRLQISEVKQRKRVYFFDLSKHFGNFISFTDSENQSHITIINASTSKANHFKVTYRSTFFLLTNFVCHLTLLKYSLIDQENYCISYMFYYTHTI